MGAGFGHTYTFNGASRPALEFGNDIDCEDCYIDEPSAQSCGCIEQHFNDLYDVLSGLKTLDFTFKTYTVSVPLTVESTYHGDGYCLVPDKYDVLDLYTDEITNHRDSDLVNWTGVMDAAIKDDGLIHAFERALCKAVQEVQPYLSVRERVCGWCGTAWQSLDEFISHLS